MKPWIRWGTAFGILGSTLLGALLAFNLQVLALTEAQIISKLALVPVFAIADQQGTPLVAATNVNDGEETVAVTGVFIQRQDAQEFIDRLKKEDPDLAKPLQVTPVSLGEVYRMAQVAKANQVKLNFDYVPAQEQVSMALSLINETRQKNDQMEQFYGVPLFVARGGKSGGYLTVEQGDQQIIPFFFNKDELQVMIDQFKQSKPDLASTVQIQVVDLQGVLETFEKDDDPQLDTVQLIPSQDSVDFVRSQVQLIRRSGQDASGVRLPTPTPSQPTPSNAQKSPDTENANTAENANNETNEN